MVVCKNCGAHYTEDFLQCPQCGSTKRITEAEEKNNNSPIGFLVTLAVVLALLGIIGYGVYFLYNPVKDDNIISDIENIDITTTTNESKTKTTAETTTKQKVTTTALVGTETTLGSHTFVIPTGFTYTEFSEEYKKQYQIPGDAICMTDNASEQYCVGIVDNKNFYINSENRDEVNGPIKEAGFSEVISARLYGSTYYYYYKPEGDSVTGGFVKNKGSYVVLSSFKVPGSEVNESTMEKLVSIIGTVK